MGIRQRMRQKGKLLGEDDFSNIPRFTPQESDILDSMDRSIMEAEANAIDAQVEAEAGVKTAAEIEDSAQSLQSKLPPNRDPEAPINEDSKDQEKPHSDFVSALAFFLPEALGGITGALIEGAEGAVAGVEATSKLKGQYLDHLDRQNLRKIQASKASDPLVHLRHQERLAQKKTESEEVQRRHKENIGLRISKFKFDVGETGAKRKDKIIATFNEDDTVKSGITALKQADSAKSLILTNSKLAPGFVARALARLSGERGVMTDKDVEAFQGDTSLFGKFARTYERAINGTLNENDKQIMLEALNSLKEVESFHFNERADNIAAQFSTANPDLNFKEVRGFLIPDKKAPVSNSRMSEEQRKKLKELRDKRAKREGK